MYKFLYKVALAIILYVVKRKLKKAGKKRG